MSIVAYTITPAGQAAWCEAYTLEYQRIRAEEIAKAEVDHLEKWGPLSLALRHWLI